uniref:Sugar phosphate transporter domain-containing protein n=1 Tax=Leersia perrieri TaxID=77586 RepID=A0A0D9VKF5_9ORYZ
MMKLRWWRVDASEVAAVTAMDVWEAVLAGGGRRFLKRKDSDAGETGRALEELRSSLYNEIHSSEGAKRQQQRFCGPGVALTFNFAVAVGIIMANKMVMGSVGFKFPIALSLIHYAVAFVLMAILKTLSLLPVAPPSKSTPFSSLFALGAVMSLSTGLANIHVFSEFLLFSVGFYQMAKIAVTPTIVVAEFMIFQKRVSSQKVIALAIVSFGVAVATVTDLEFNFFGALVALAWIVPSAVNKILWSNLQQSGNWTALAATSALSHVVLGQFKTIVIMLSGYLIFSSDPGITSICGAIVALGGMSVYTYLGLKESATGGKKPSSAQNSFLVKPKADGNGEKPGLEHEDSV